MFSNCRWRPAPAQRRPEGLKTAMPEWEDKVQNAAQRVEGEVHRLIEYLNDEVVPDVRRHGSTALRVAADRLHELARSLDDKTQGGGTPGS